MILFFNFTLKRRREFKPLNYSRITVYFMKAIVIMHMYNYHRLQCIITLYVFHSELIKNTTKLVNVKPI